jgi:hypothetical protein
MKTTTQLFDTTNAALLAGDFSTARQGLEILSRRDDHVDLFASAAVYLARVAPMQRAPLAARLLEADRAAERNLARRAAGRTTV